MSYLLQMNDSLDKLTHSVTDMTSLYNKSVDPQSQSVKSSLPLQAQKSAVPSQTSPLAVFMSQVPFKQYYDAEEGFTTQLTAYTRKQFFQV